MKTNLAALSIVLAFAVVPARAPAAVEILVTPSDLNWTDAAALRPGAKLAMIEGALNLAVPFMFRLKLPANYEIPAHWHAAIEHITVISGTFHLGNGDRLDKSRTRPLPAGSAAVLRAKTNHFAWTKEETIIQVHGVGPWDVTYVNPADDPRKK